MTRRLSLLLGSLVLAVPAVSLGAAPTADVHALKWFVHIDLIDAGAGMDLAFYEALIDDWEAEASQQLEGFQGPVDTPCCTRIERSVSVATFGSMGDGLDVLDSAAKYTTIDSIGTPGSRAFLVDSITYCDGSAPNAIGCAEQPSCDGDGDDDPTLYLVTTMDALDSNEAVGTLAHERGHNACLGHINTEECQLMRSAAGGGCIDATECSDFQAGRTTTGGSCTCHAMGSGILDDGAMCNAVASGQCSGGLCGDGAGSAGIALLAAAGPGAGDGEIPDDALLLSGLPGGWSDLGAFGMSGEVVEGLTYAHDSGVLYGVVPGSGDDALVTIDPVTGDILSTVATHANGSKEYIALAYDPGPTSDAGDDELLVLETDGTFEDLYAIDTDSPGTATLVGGLATGGADGFRGLAYDSANGVLYTSSPFADGIYEIDVSSCNPPGVFCSVNQQVGAGVVRFDSGLAYSPDTGMLHLIGGQAGLAPLGRRTLYDILDPSTFVAEMETIQVDAFTTGGLAALPVAAAPKVPVSSGLGLAGLVLLSLGGVAARGLRRAR